MDVNWILDSPFESLPVGDPAAEALSIDGQDALTYAELRDLRDHYIALLQQEDVKSGDRVGILLLNSVDYIALYFAITRLGAIAVRLNFRLTARELEFILNDSGCSIVVLHGSRLDQVSPIRGDVSVRSWVVLPDTDVPAPEWARQISGVVSNPPMPDLPRPAGTDPLMLMYTSGTTGRPKGVVWTHDGTLWLALIQATKWSYTPSTKALTTGPLYHAGAFEDLLLPALFVHGKAIAMSSGGLTTSRIVQAIQDGRATHVLLYPFLLYDLLRSTDVTPVMLDSVERLLTGGDPVLPWALKAIDDRFPNMELQQAYGLTEGGTMSTVLEHEYRLEHPDSVGRPTPLTQVRTLAADGSETQAGQVGEVWVRGPHVAAGYWNNPEATAETFVNGWCRTGDLGRVTEDGFLVLTGRAKDMYRSGGENVYPVEIETAISTHPAVAAVAVVGVPDSAYIEVGCAYIVLAAGASESIDETISDLRSHAKDRLAGYKCPRHYVIVDELPVSAAGKVRKNELRAQFAATNAPEVSMSP